MMSGLSIRTMILLAFSLATLGGLASAAPTELTPTRSAACLMLAHPLPKVRPVPNGELPLLTGLLRRIEGQILERFGDKVQPVSSDISDIAYSYGDLFDSKQNHQSHFPDENKAGYAFNDILKAQAAATQSRDFKGVTFIGQLIGTEDIKSFLADIRANHDSLSLQQLAYGLHEPEIDSLDSVVVNGITIGEILRDRRKSLYYGAIFSGLSAGLGYQLADFLNSYALYYYSNSEISAIFSLGAGLVLANGAIAFYETSKLFSKSDRIPLREIIKEKLSEETVIRLANQGLFERPLQFWEGLRRLERDLDNGELRNIHYTKGWRFLSFSSLVPKSYANFLKKLNNFNTPEDFKELLSDESLPPADEKGIIDEKELVTFQLILDVDPHGIPTLYVLQIFEPSDGIYHGRKSDESQKEQRESWIGIVHDALSGVITPAPTPAPIPVRNR